MPRPAVRMGWIVLTPSPAGCYRTPANRLRRSSFVGRPANHRAHPCPPVNVAADGCAASAIVLIATAERNGFDVPGVNAGRVVWARASVHPKQSGADNRWPDGDLEKPSTEKIVRHAVFCKMFCLLDGHPTRADRTVGV